MPLVVGLAGLEPFAVVVLTQVAKKLSRLGRESLESKAHHFHDAGKRGTGRP